MNCWEYKNYPTKRRDSSTAYSSRGNESGKVTDAKCGDGKGNIRSKITKFITGLVLFVLVFVSVGHAEEEVQSSPQKESFKFIETEFREWFTAGESMWRISFFDDFWGRGESKLEFQGIDAFVHMGTVRIKPWVYWLTLEGTMGSGDIYKGEVIDSDMFEDWIFSWSGWRDVWSESKSDADGDITIMDAKMSLRIYPWEENAPYYVDLFAGYNYYRERIHMTNGKQTIPAFGAFDGLDSTYEFLWESYPVGLKFNWDVNKEVHPWLYNFSIVSSVSVGPVKYRGEGVWNLRTDFKQDPSFKHEADQGYAFLGDIGFIYQPIRYISFKAGYQFYQFEAQDGTDTTFFSDGTEGTADLDQVKSSRFGPYASFSLLF